MCASCEWLVGLSHCHGPSILHCTIRQLRLSYAPSLDSGVRPERAGDCQAKTAQSYETPLVGNPQCPLRPASGPRAVGTDYTGSREELCLPPSNRHAHWRRQPTPGLPCARLGRPRATGAAPPARRHVDKRSPFESSPFLGLLPRVVEYPKTCQCWAFR